MAGITKKIVDSRTKKFIVITTINEKTAAIDDFENFDDWQVIVVGDKKSIPMESSDTLVYLSVEDQENLGYLFTEHCPFNHYARKNIGYLYAISQGAEVIYETDDDNRPADNWYQPSWSCISECSSGSGIVNPYRYFSDELIWPRGLPLESIHASMPSFQVTGEKSIGVWQGLADKDPDVDAIFRLVFKEEVYFEQRDSIYLKRHNYSPFNSQNTFWHKAAFPLLYLPAMVSFRFTDILRGYIAQRLLWEQELHLGFLSATVVQERNQHDLMADFEQEVDCYLVLGKLIELLEDQKLSGSCCDNMRSIYSVLEHEGIVSSKELALCFAWLRDYENVSGK